VGIDDKFLKQLAVNVKPGTSVLLVLVRHVTVDKVLEQLKRHRGRDPEDLPHARGRGQVSGCAEQRKAVAEKVIACNSAPSRRSAALLAKVPTLAASRRLAESAPDATRIARIDQSFL
jgi:hypothetical protein